MRRWRKTASPTRDANVRHAGRRRASIAADLCTTSTSGVSARRDPSRGREVGTPRGGSAVGVRAASARAVAQHVVRLVLPAEEQRERAGDDVVGVAEQLEGDVGRKRWGARRERDERPAEQRVGVLRGVVRSAKLGRLEAGGYAEVSNRRLQTHDARVRASEHGGDLRGALADGGCHDSATLEGLELTTAFLPGGDRGRGPFTRRESSPSRDVSTRTDGSSRVSPAARFARVAVCGARSPQNLDAISSSESGSQGRRRASYSVRPRFRRRPTFSGATTSPISRQSRQRAMRVVLGLAGAFGGAVAAVTGTAVGYGYMLGSARSPARTATARSVAVTPEAPSRPTRVRASTRRSEDAPTMVSRTRSTMKSSGTNS